MAPEDNKASVLDLMKLRGGFGIAGQSLMIASGLYRGEKLKVWSAGVSMLANLINLSYGVQKKEDVQHLLEAERSIECITGAMPEVTVPPALAQGVLGKADAFMGQHSVRVSDGMKLGAKYLFRLSGIEANNAANKWHGNLSMMAKVMTLVGKDEDPYVPASQKSSLTHLREMSNMVSGGMELIAQYPLFPGALNRRNERLNRMEHDWLQLGGAGFFVAALVAKMCAPFTVTAINRDALYAYAAGSLNMLTPDQRGQHQEAVIDVVQQALDKEAVLRKLPARQHVSREDILAEITRRIAQPVEVPQEVVRAVQHQGHTQDSHRDRWVS